MDLDLMRTFLEVYRAGTLTAAARSLGLAQPTVTTHLRTLERELAQQLFERLPRGVAPTAVADELAARIGPHIDALAAVARTRPGHRLARPVNLAGPVELTTVKVLPSLAPLVERGLRLRVTMGLADDLLAGLPTGRYDLVLSTVRPRTRATHAVPLTDEEFVLVANPAWAARIGDRVRVDGAAALRDVPLITYAEELPIIRRYWRSVFGHRPTASAAVVVPDLRGVLAATVAGAGVTVLPRYLCAGEFESGALVALLEPEIPPINTLYLATRAGMESTPGIAEVRAHLLMQSRLWS
ncbi:LysR family transcriptional regulator [Actinokineospora inagensis]|uniref:LysR family transcriptional regulator n=1 Tax=Actinokineospora inagensis TaxID=103730 RepID=UPI00042580BC|nr:LysR family transcriptional regulator [Actinokineospora inagensis]